MFLNVSFAAMAPALLGGLLLLALWVAALVIWLLRRQSRSGQGDSGLAEATAAAKTRRRAEPRSRFPDLEEKLNFLARRFWRSQEVLDIGHFRKNPQMIPWSSHEAAAKALLEHARKVAPGIGIQTLVPQVVVKAESGAAGTFQIESEGWFHVTLHPAYATNRPLAHAVLAHELCHYILAANGIELKDTNQNERLTEVAAYVLGFGDLYAQRDLAIGGSTSDHRLGYLTGEERRFLQERSQKLRETNGLGLPTELDLRKQELRSMVFAEGSRENLVATARQSFPHYSDLDIYRYVIERLRRDLK